MARPSTALIIKKNIIAQFQGWGIRTIINLQTPGEHASCGGPLEPSGFTYDPNDFMRNDIYYYNFAWKDYGDATMGKLLDMAKVVAFAVQEGRVAIHCHAGLGRTGVLIACYLVYSLRVRANDAIRFVRLKRPCAVQTRGQILCVQEFEHHVLPQILVFPVSSAIRKPYSLQSFLSKQQSVLHGYEQRTFKYIPKIVFTICERILQLCDCREDNSPAEIKFLVSSTPFTTKFICHAIERKTEGQNFPMRHSFSWMESLAGSSYDVSSGSTTTYAASTPGSSRETLQNSDTSEDLRRLNDVFCPSPDVPSCSSYQGLDDNCVDDVLGDGIRGQDLYDNDCYKEIQSHLDLKAAAQTETFRAFSTEEAVKALLCDHTSLAEEQKKRLRDYQIDLNNRQTAWQRLELETDLSLLSGLLYEWLETLKRPVLDLEDLSHIVIWSSKEQECLHKLQTSTRYLLEYLLRFLSRLRPLTMETQNLLGKRLMAALTQQCISINHILFPAGKNFHKLRHGTAGKLNEFFLKTMNLIEEINTQSFYSSHSTSAWEISTVHQTDTEDNEDDKHV
ncbi:protein tyrosine phosphatase domain-containing protein 1 isoform X2 [Cephus cinctus]|nr:protein tyrosine phosphatase domain-containing protein 1 isoform X2 [Cephus cinctus]XP_015606540.1 protein tyrosine phosphatase domain-containing protein 1 isoform X2 [Cephus cinctus]